MFHHRLELDVIASMIKAAHRLWFSMHILKKYPSLNIISGTDNRLSVLEKAFSEKITQLNQELYSNKMIPLSTKKEEVEAFFDDDLGDAWFTSEPQIYETMKEEIVDLEIKILQELYTKAKSALATNDLPPQTTTDMVSTLKDIIEELKSLDPERVSIQLDETEDKALIKAANVLAQKVFFPVKNQEELLCYIRGVHRNLFKFLLINRFPDLITDEANWVMTRAQNNLSALNELLVEHHFPALGATLESEETYQVFVSDLGRRWVNENSMAFKNHLAKMTEIKVMHLLRHQKELSKEEILPLLDLRTVTLKHHSMKSMNEIMDALEKDLLVQEEKHRQWQEHINAVASGAITIVQPNWKTLRK